MSPATKTTCRLCLADGSAYLWSKNILDPTLAIVAHYYECSHCGFVQTQEPHWLSHAYSSPINISDTGLLVRNINNAHTCLATMLALGLSKDKLIDYAGGYGVLVRLLRDIGIDAYWQDKFCENLFARGFEFKMTAPPSKIGMVCAFEAMEHFVNPLEEIEKLFTLSPNLLVSTELIQSPPPKQWWYYGVEHGQHIGFFSRKSFEFLAQKFNKHYYCYKNAYHLLTHQPLSSVKWQSLLLIRQALPVLTKVFIKSKTWPDHFQMMRTLDMPSADSKQPSQP